ncbi:hypothetical protein LCGC14_3146520 [marine sediment metagenome]|uniref:Uncharacterized protein n=1 Tax=marine sediment metagenome TaxID=412755 RepID=A0A0F8VVC9_9ZZZZ
MWKEILVDDIEGLQKYVEVFNDVKCGIKVGSLSWLQQKLRWKIDAQCFFYEGDEFKICLMSEYDSTHDRIVVFQCLIKFLKAPKNPDKIFEVCAENCKLLLKRHQNIIRVPKYPEYFTVRDVGISQQENTNNQIRIYEKIGIKVTDFEKYWEYELM